MRVLFDGYWWDSGPRANANVQKEIVAAWRTSFPEDEIAIATRSISSELPEGIELFQTKLPLQALVNRFELPRISKKWCADLVIAHNFAVPAKGAKSLVFIHDFIFLEHPEWFTYSENRYFSLMKNMAKNADVVGTSSRTEAKRLNTHLRRTDSVASGLAISTSLRDASPKRPSGVHVDKFLLTVGRLNVRKNLERTIEAAVNSGRVTPDVPLIVVGEPHGRAEQFSIRTGEAIRNGAVIFLSGVSDSELRWLYERASITLFLSLDEGYGLPGIEAMHFGSPLIASKIPVFEELLYDYASFVNQTSLSAISAKISSLHVLNSSRQAVHEGREGNTWADVVARLRFAALAADSD